MRTLVSLCDQPDTQFSTSVHLIPDSREKSGDPVRDRLELVDHHLHVSRQVLAVLHPDDGGLQPGVGDVDGAVEFGLMALRQLDAADGGLEAQPPELIRGQINPRDAGRDHVRL